MKRVTKARGIYETPLSEKIHTLWKCWNENIYIEVAESLFKEVTV
jgi:hypothetical protein